MSENTEREAMRALMRQLSQKGEPGIVSAYCPKHRIITGSRLVAVTPLDRYAFERFDYGKPGEPKLIRMEMTRMGCPQCEAEGFRGAPLDGLGLPSEEHRGHATTNFHAAERSAQYAVENCDLDELRSGLINAGAAAAHAYSEGNERTEARAMALADRMVSGFRQKCAIKRKG